MVLLNVFDKLEFCPLNQGDVVVVRAKFNASDRTLVIEVEQLFIVLEQWRTAVPKINWALSRSNHTKC